MAKYRKKPVVIEAFPVRDLLESAGMCLGGVPEWVMDAIGVNVIVIVPGSVQITTLEGVMVGDIDDMIIQGVRGEIYPCKPDIFAATYEPAD